MKQPNTSVVLDDETARTVVDAMLPLLDLHIDPAWRAEVIANLKVNARMARLVLEFPLDDELDVAPVFKA
jgi:Protein of unknown function (DUF4089)